MFCKHQLSCDRQTRSRSYRHISGIFGKVLFSLTGLCTYSAIIRQPAVPHGSTSPYIQYEHACLGIVYKGSMSIKKQYLLYFCQGQQNMMSLSCQTLDTHIDCVTVELRPCWVNTLRSYRWSLKTMFSIAEKKKSNKPCFVNSLLLTQSQSQTQLRHYVFILQPDTDHSLIHVFVWWFNNYSTNVWLSHQSVIKVQPWQKDRNSE